MYDHEHRAFRQTARAFSDAKIAPHLEEWDDAGIVPRELWLEAGKLGLLAWMMPTEYGGGGVDDFRYNVIAREELVRIGATAVGFTVHNDICSGYFRDLTNEEQKQRWLPGFCDGSRIAALAMTEPEAGSDASNIRTTARAVDGGFIVKGSKVFISNGINADLVITAVKTDPDAGHKGISLLVLERGMEGFERGRNLKKLGMRGQDTAELYFDDVFVPAENLMGELNRGFYHLMGNLVQERLGIAVGAVAASERILNLTVDYAKNRQAFGQPIGSFQNSRFVLAELATEVTVARVFIDRLVGDYIDDPESVTAERAAMAKWWTTELQSKVMDRCLQLHGGYGYMLEQPVSRAFADTRIQTIAGGSTEIMKEIIGRSMGL